MSVFGRRVASRWGLRVVTSANPRPIPQWVFDWGADLDRRISAVHLAYIGEKDDYSVTHILDTEAFEAAKESLNALLPKFRAMLQAKFHETYYADVSQTSTRVYYFFSANSELESFAITLAVRQGDVFLALGYVPAHVSQHSLDYSKAIEVSERIQDPDMAGLALMRLTRKLLVRI